MPHFSTQLTLFDLYGLFFLQSSFINFPSVLINVPFQIGASCNATSGQYFVNFNSTNLVNFYQMSPIIVIVDSSSPNTISIVQTTNVPDGSLAVFSLLLSDFTSTNMTFSFYGTNWNSDNPDISISNVTVPAYQNYVTGFINITGTRVLGNQTVGVYSPNGCFVPSVYLFNFRVNGTITDFPSNFNASAAFSNFVNGDNNQVMKNQYQFTFTPPMAPLDLYCVFICLNKNFPSNDDIINQNLKSNFEKESLKQNQNIEK